MNKVNKIFKEIEAAVIRFRSPYPVTIEDSRFLQELKRIKAKYVTTEIKKKHL